MEVIGWTNAVQTGDVGRVHPRAAGIAAFQPVGIHEPPSAAEHRLPGAEPRLVGLSAHVEAQFAAVQDVGVREPRMGERFAVQLDALHVQVLIRVVVGDQPLTLSWVR